MPLEVVASILQVARTVVGSQELAVDTDADLKNFEVPAVRILGVGTRIRFGIPLAIRRGLGWGAWSYYGLKRLFT
jgi:hypothetical protein